MGLFRDLIYKLNPVQPALRAREPVASSGTETIAVNEAYSRIEIVRRAFDMIIGACTDIPYRVEGGAAKKIDKILNWSPNPFESQVQVFRKAYMDFLMEGNAFFYYDGSNIFHLPSAQVQVIPDEKTYVSGYTYTTTSTSMWARRVSTNNQIQFTPEEIIHIKDDNNESLFRGKSKLSSLGDLLALYNNLIKFQKQFFKNNAIPGVVLETDSVLGKPVKERILEEWRSLFSALSNNARSTAILDGGLKINKISEVNFQSLDFEASVERLQVDISKALGVPYVLLKSGNNANIQANEVLFYEHTILPMMRQFASSFQAFFYTSTITPDDSGVAALQPDLKTQATYCVSLVNGGIITPNEGRVKLNWPKILDDKEADKLRIPQNVTGSATRPDTGGRPVSTSTDGEPA